MMAILALCGGLLAVSQLAIPDVVRSGWPSVAYGAVTGVMVLLGLTLLVGGRRTERLGPALVLWGNVSYLVASLCVADPGMHAPPLGLLFATLGSAVLLGPRLLAVQSVLAVPVLTVALSGVYGYTSSLGVQVVMHALILDATGLAIFVLRRRSEQLLEQIYALTTVDPLTGLPNRRHVDERAAALVADARRSGRYLTALLLDIDHFKEVNDVHGHATGDEVLVRTAERLRLTLREGDVAARIGGEEMLVLAPVGSRADAYRLADRLQAAARGVDDPVSTTCSMGVAVEPAPGPVDSVAWVWSLAAAADAAMYRAKALGRNRWEMAPPAALALTDLEPQMLDLTAMVTPGDVPTVTRSQG